MRRAAFAGAVAVAIVVVLGTRAGRVQWWTANGPLALPALHPADRALVKAAEAVIDAS